MDKLETEFKKSVYCLDFSTFELNQNLPYVDKIMEDEAYDALIIGAGISSVSSVVFSSRTELNEVRRTNR